ncbi:MAG: response regulator transcription factor [Thermodesulfobacteriota bacterium]
MQKYIAIIEDEPDIVELEEKALRKEGFTTKAFYSGDVFLESLVKDKPKFNLFILDLMLPGIGGLDILKNLKNQSHYEMYKRTPVLIVSAKDSEIDKVIGLELGSDDYLPKPFSPRELTARVKAILRRSQSIPSDNTEESVIKISGLTIDEKRFQAYADNKPIDLTTAEFKLLLTLSKRKTWVFDRNKIIDSIWHSEKYVTDRTVDVHIKHLRQKMGKYGDLIKTVRGMGYKIEES